MRRSFGIVAIITMMILISPVTAASAVVIGDSMAMSMNYGRLCTSSESCPTFDEDFLNQPGSLSYELSENYTTGYTWYNHGIGGEESGAVLSRYSSDAIGPSTHLPEKTSAIIVFVGTNDLAHGQSVASLKANVGSMISASNAAQIKTIFVTMEPLDPEYYSETVINGMTEYNRYLMEDIQAKSDYVVPYNMHDWLMDSDGTIKMEYRGRPNDRSDCHINNAAYLRIASEIMAQYGDWLTDTHVPRTSNAKISVLAFPSVNASGYAQLPLGIYTENLSLITAINPDTKVQYQISFEGGNLAISKISGSFASGVLREPLMFAYNNVIYVIRSV